MTPSHVDTDARRQWYAQERDKRLGSATVDHSIRLLAAPRLNEAGTDSVRILNNAGDFGGVCYWNRYPGAQCDTTSMEFLPLLEGTGHIPTHGEIRAHPGDLGARPPHRQALRPLHRRSIPHPGHRNPMTRDPIALADPHQSWRTDGEIRETSGSSNSPERSIPTR
jgi:hypothetical protein